MPSERRRQRQQRVRHEPGDFVPSAKEDSDKSGSESVSKTFNSENLVKKFDQNSNSGSTSEQAHVENSTPIANNHSQEREKRNFSQRRSTEGSGHNKQNRGGSSKGKLEIQRQPQHTQIRQVVANVAFQEEREYEPVMIMESKPKGDKEQPAPSLPEPTKYKRSEVISNWLQYDDLPPEEENIEDGEDYLMGEDFSHVLNLSVNKSSGGFLHLKGEMSWGNVDQSHLENHGLGALKVADLIASLGTIPLYEQLKIPGDSLPIHIVSCMKASAEKNRASYKPDQEYVTDIEINRTILEKLKLNESEPIRLSTEEPKLSETHNTLGATSKFTSAFKPEPTDVDLDKFDREGTPDLSLQETSKDNESLSDNSMTKALFTDDLNKNTNTTIELPKILKKEESKISNTKHEPIKTLPKQQENKPQFDFGLVKANKHSGKTDYNKKHDQKSETFPDNESRQPKLTTPVDLNKPLSTEKQAPVLVKESDVENLEDWLDSVLDD